MCASQAALFLLQRDGFSCPDTQDFQQTFIKTSEMLSCIWKFSTCFKRVFNRVFACLSLFTRVSNALTLAKHWNISAGVNSAGVAPVAFTRSDRKRKIFDAQTESRIASALCDSPACQPRANPFNTLPMSGAGMVCAFSWRHF